jgi:peptide methionine sulfoxide reductase
MWKLCRSSLVKCKSQSLFRSFPRYLIFTLGMALCPQAQGGQANAAFFAGGRFWCTKAVFQQARGVSSVVSGHMQGAETIQITFDPSKTSYDKLLNLFWRAHNPTEIVYGLIVFSINNFATAPFMSWLRSLYLHTPVSFRPPMGWVQAIIHVFCVGLPIPLVLRKFGHGSIRNHKASAQTPV